MPVGTEENTLVLEKHWIVCYRGTANNTTIQDPYLCLFRVQAVNNCRQITVCILIRLLIIIYFIIIFIIQLQFLLKIKKNYLLLKGYS